MALKYASGLERPVQEAGNIDQWMVLDPLSKSNMSLVSQENRSFTNRQLDQVKKVL